MDDNDMPEQLIPINKLKKLEHVEVPALMDCNLVISPFRRVWKLYVSFFGVPFVI